MPQPEWEGRAMPPARWPRVRRVVINYEMVATLSSFAPARRTRPGRGADQFTSHRFHDRKTLDRTRDWVFK